MLYFDFYLTNAKYHINHNEIEEEKKLKIIKKIPINYPKAFAIINKKPKL